MTETERQRQRNRDRERHRERNRDRERQRKTQTDGQTCTFLAANLQASRHANRLCTHSQSLSDTEREQRNRENTNRKDCTFRSPALVSHALLQLITEKKR